MKKLIASISLIACTTSFAQVANTGIMDTTNGEHIGKITVGGYIDSYYGYNFSKPAGNNNPYLVSMSRSNETTINLAYIDLRYNTEKVRARIVPGVGTYMNSNYASEPGLLKNIVEASAGLRLNKTKNIWFDFGVIGSPFTNESAISKDHLLYTRSLAAENAPYYLSGAKVSVALTAKTNLYLYLLNGWQQIQDQNQHKAFASQLEFRPNDKNLFNWNLYMGDERSSTNINFRNRYFSDLYWIYDSGNKFSSTACAYFGIQEKTSSTATWWSANYSAKYSFNNRQSLSARIEYFSDANNVLLTSITPNTQFSVYSGSIGFNLKIANHALFRLENRLFYSDKNNFLDDKNNAVKMMNLAVSNITVWF